jgi:hypothetical protein
LTSVLHYSKIQFPGFATAIAAMAVAAAAVAAARIAK